MKVLSYLVVTKLDQQILMVWTLEQHQYIVYLQHLCWQWRECVSCCHIVVAVLYNTFNDNAKILFNKSNNIILDRHAVTRNTL